ncbi:MAG TPA: NAD(+) synthase [Candidatus Desulfofervidus auxilii]|uniref:NH(3)-dependent NAD(+) synthetase n=1 Tax=Desulfofervidus auxilii TaxID=1621989 RepID=A0A7V1N2K5_DESA2|nr:NAD(+) synthase [Candidatus Desulfofervidus auxilii]
MSNILLEELKAEMKIKPEKVVLSLENFIREYTEKLERKGVILGLSGGVDSAVVAAIGRHALGPKKVLALIMPEKDSKKEHTQDALNLAQELGIDTKLINITPYLEELGVYKLFPWDKTLSWGRLKGVLVKKAYHFYERKTGKIPFLESLSGFEDKEYSSYLARGNAYYRAKHRLRMLLLYLYGELENRLVVGAANKSEYKIGYFVKHGCDDATDIMPLLNLYKTQVREMARHLNIPSRIIEKPPSPDVMPGLNDDEEVMGISYEKMDLILLALEKGWKIATIVKDLGIEEDRIIYIKRLMQKSEHMRRIFIPENYSS